LLNRALHLSRLAFVAFALSLCVQHPAFSQRVVRESDLKATLLFNFSQFTQWPDTAFAATNAPFVIGIIGADPFGNFIDELVKTERAQGRPIVIQRFNNPNEAAAAQILFVSRDESRRMASVLAALGNNPVLTICDAPDRTEGTKGCMIALVKKQNAIRIRINLDRSRKAGLTISSKLLHFADVVKSD
jgi:hypothetical protein